MRPFAELATKVTARRSGVFFLAAWGILPFVLLSLFGVFHHEPWRDETHHYLLATETPGFFEMLREAKASEPSPLLWFALLRMAHSIMPSHGSAVALHWLVMAAAVLLLWVRAPLSGYEKMLISCSYFFLYEHAVIVRNYGLGILGLFAVLMAYPERNRRPWLYASLIGLLAQTNLFGAIFSGLFVLLLLGEHRGHPFWGPTALAIGMILLATTGIAPPVYEPQAAQTMGAFARDLPSWLRNLNGALLIAFLPVPHLMAVTFPHTGIGMSTLVAPLPLLFLAWLIILTPSRRQAALFYGAGMVLLLVFFATQGGWLRHVSHLFLLVVAARWLEQQQVLSGEDDILPTPISAGVRRMVFLFILILQVSCALTALYIEWDKPFSHAKGMASLMNEKLHDMDPENTLIATFHSSRTEAIIPHLDRKWSFYSLEIQRPYRYLSFAPPWRTYLHSTEAGDLNLAMRRFLQRVQTKESKRAFLLLARPITPQFQDPQIHFKLFAARDEPNPITLDEIFYMYELYWPGRASP